MNSVDVVRERRGLLRRHAELRAEVSGADRLVRVRVDTGRDAHEHPLDARAPRTFKLFDGVEDHVRGARLGRRTGLLVRLVVAVHDDPLAGNPGALREAEL